MITDQPSHVSAESDAVPSGERRLDGLLTYLQMLGRVMSPAPAWGEATGQAESAFLDVLRVTAAAIPHAAAVSVTQTTSGRPRTVVGTSDAAQSADALQYATKQGPCLEAIATEAVFGTGDLTTDTRWPQLAQLAERTPLRSVLSVPLAEAGMRRASLNIYSEHEAAWSPEDATCGLIGTVVAGALLAMSGLNHQGRVVNLEHALESNRSIAAAVGIVMSERRCSYDAAFELITRVSQNSNVKLRQVAEQVVLTGTLGQTTT